MKLQQLEALVKVVEHGSIREAARQLHLSQAAVTKSMRMLEEEAGVPLLLRRSRGVDLTEAGRRLVARARVVTRQVALAHEDLRQTGDGDTGSLRVAVSPLVTLTVLGEAFNWFRQRFRHVQVEFVDGLMQRVMPRLRDGTLDLAVVAIDAGEQLGEEFNVERLRNVPQRVVVRQGHPVLQDPTPQALVRLEWIATRPMSADRLPRLAAVFAQVGLSPPKQIVVCEALHAFALQRNSDAVSIMPEPPLNTPETRGIVAIEPCAIQPFDLELTLVSRADVPLSPAAGYFAHCVAQLCRNPKSGWSTDSS